MRIYFKIFTILILRFFMFIKKVLNYRNAWENLNNNYINELCEFKAAINFNYSENILKCKLNDPYLLNSDCVLKIRDNLSKLGWEEDYYNNFIDHYNDRQGYIGGIGHKKNKIAFKNFFNTDDIIIWLLNDIQNNFSLDKVDIAIQYISIDMFESNGISVINEINNILDLYTKLSLKTPFLVLELSREKVDIEVVDIHLNQIKIERSIEFKPEHYQAGLGILSYFGTVLRKKYPEQNAKVRIEQDDNTVRLVVESADGNKEVIESAFDEFGLVIYGDMQPEKFYENYLDVAELKTKLGTFESELKFQHQLIEMKEHRIIELQKDKEFLENVIGKALIRPNSPIYINNQLHNTQSTVINHKAEFTKSNDELEDLIDLVDSEAMKNRLATIQNALEINRNSDQPEEVKDSSGMKKLAKFLKDVNEVGTEANTLAEKGGKALDLIKSLGRSYNSLAQWCGMPVIPSVLVKE